VNGDDRVNEDATARRRQLGRLLRRARETAGYTQTAVAKRLGCGQAKVNKIETTLVEIDLPELEKLLELYRMPTDEAAELRKLAELDQQEGPARTKYSNSMTAFGVLSELEPEASEIRCWHSERIPGPLQSEMYILRQHEPLLADDPAAVTRILRERHARTKVFTVPNPPRYRVILSESSLRRMPGGRTTQMVVDQTEHLLKLMDTHEQLELRILTFDADIPYVDSDFQHLTFDDPRHCEFLYIEYPGGSRKCKTPYELSKCAEHWTALSTAALDLAKSREFLNDLARRDESSAH
jgi:transcriptional regulator with XRE-family HTH domain